MKQKSRFKSKKMRHKEKTLGAGLLLANIVLGLRNKKYIQHYRTYFGTS